MTPGHCLAHFPNVSGTLWRDNYCSFLFQLLVFLPNFGLLGGENRRIFFPTSPPLFSFSFFSFQSYFLIFLLSVNQFAKNVRPCWDRFLVYCSTIKSVSCKLTPCWFKNFWINTKGLSSTMFQFIRIYHIIKGPHSK